MAKTTLMLCCFLGLSATVFAHRKGPLRAYLPDPQPMVYTGQDPGEPLFLTPYIEAGKITEAQKLSRVGPLEGTTVESYSGFLTVDKAFKSNMFFWFFPAQNKPETAPVLLWLQGGPGGSSLFGLFVESGPFGVDKNVKIFPKNVTWTSKYSVLYIDNPVGTGFSFTGSDEGYSTNETHVAKNLYSAVSQFFKLFPNLKKNDFYITGESYAGKYLPALAYHTFKYGNPKDVPLKGVAIGDGFSDPETMLPAYADYLFNIGMLDEGQREYFRAGCQQAVALIRAGKYAEAFTENNKMLDFFHNVSGQDDLYNYLRTDNWDSLLNGDQTPYPSFFTNVSGSTNYFNFLRTQSPAAYDYYPKLLALPSVRKSIHVGALAYNTGDLVEKHLMNDIMDTVKPWLATVMDNYKVLIYSGQLDIIVAAPLTEAMLQTVPWSQLQAYKLADRTVWKVEESDAEVAGYVRSVKNFHQVIVRGGGHILPYDQPRRTMDMLDRFISGRGF